MSSFDGVDEPPNICSKREDDEPCCWHEIQRDSTRSAGMSWAAAYGTMVKVEQCCWCQRTKTLHFSLEKDEEHGPYAPKVWERVK